jgi:hypothetical protein
VIDTEKKEDLGPHHGPDLEIAVTVTATEGRIEIESIEAEIKMIEDMIGIVVVGVPLGKGGEGDILLRGHGLVLKMSMKIIEEGDKVVVVVIEVVVTMITVDVDMKSVIEELEEEEGNEVEEGGVLVESGKIEKSL